MLITGEPGGGLSDEGLYGHSVPSVQFFCKPKPAFKKSINFFLMAIKYKTWEFNQECIQDLYFYFFIFFIFF